MDNETIPILDDIFVELANPSRNSMLFKLNKNQYKQSQLASELDISIQDSHRQLKRLTSSGFVQKNGKGFLSLTPFGKIIVSQLTSFIFLQKFKGYFMNHDTSNLPSKFLNRIGDLLSCELLEGTFKIAEKWEEMCNETKKHMNVISNGCPAKANEWDIASCKRGATIKILNGKNTVMTKTDFQTIMNSKPLQQLTKDGLYKRRLVNKVSIFMVSNENEATIQFEDLNGRIDPNFAFHGTSEKFMEWCSDFFEYRWKNSKEFDFSKLDTN